jgi:hypothetical protein
MRRLIVLACLLLSLVFASALTLAQETETLPPCTVVLQDATTLETLLSLSFARLSSSLSLPDEVLGVRRIACDIAEDDIVSLQTSPSIGINESVPSDENDPELVEALPGYAIVNVAYANLRSGPAPEYSRVGVVGGGSYLIVLGRNEGNVRWWYVQSGDLIGWVSGELVVGRGELSNLPIIETQGEFVPATLYVGFVGNPIYDQLSLAGKITCNITGGGEFILLGRSFNEAWYKIEATCLDGRPVTGWIAADRGFVRNPSGLLIPILEG